MKKIILLTFMFTAVVFQRVIAMNSLKKINENDLVSYFFSENKNKTTVKSFIEDKKTDHRPSLYQKFSSRFTAYTSARGAFSKKRSFCKIAKYGKNRNKWCNCDEHGNSIKALSWSVDGDGNIKVKDKWGEDCSSLSKDEYFEAKFSFGGIVRPEGFLSAFNYRYALLMAWCTENKNKDIINSKRWFSESNPSESHEKVWKYRHDLSFEQAALCIALQHKCYKKNMDGDLLPVKIGPHKYAYDVFCFLPMEMQNELVDNLGWVKLPVLRRGRNLLVNYPGLSSLTLGVVTTGISYPLIKMILKSNVVDPKN